MKVRDAEDGSSLAQVIEDKALMARHSKVVGQESMTSRVSLAQQLADLTDRRRINYSLKLPLETSSLFKR